MQPFDVLIKGVPDPELGPLLTQLHAQGFDPITTPVDVQSVQTHPGAPDADADLPAAWNFVRELEGQAYRWPQQTEPYLTYRVFVGNTATNGRVNIALGEAERTQVWGRDRKYLIAFLTSGSPQVPLVEFLQVDDYDDTHEMMAIIRGNGGERGKRMYGPGDSLPGAYAQNFRIEVVRDRIVYPGAYDKMAVVAHEDDTATMLNHALLQARRRGDLRTRPESVR
jgi:hypothetical protein